MSFAKKGKKKEQISFSKNKKIKKLLKNVLFLSIITSLGSHFSNQKLVFDVY
jgi:hypothetical protein